MSTNCVPWPDGPPCRLIMLEHGPDNGAPSGPCIQRDPGGLAQGFVDLDLGSSPGWWATTVATYCPSRMVEHPKSKSAKPCARPPGSRCTIVARIEFIPSFLSNLEETYANPLLPTYHLFVWLSFIFNIAAVSFTRYAWRT